MTDIISSILAINPKAAASVENDDISKITWLHGTTPIANSDILVKQKELIAEYNSKEYQRKRESEYPPIVDQLDDLYHNGIDGWKKTIKAIKDKYPKE